MRKISRFAVYLCILLIFNEFGPAHFRLVHQLKANNEQVARNEKRVWSAAKTLLTYAFKALQLSSKYLADITGLVSIISTVYSSIAKCESSSWGPQTKEYTDQAKEIVELINEHSGDIYAIQLQTENLQVQVETLNYNFNQTLEEMEEAGYLSQRFLEIVQPDIEGALNQTTTELIEELEKAKKAGTKVDYATLSKTYYLRVDKFVNLAVPLFVSAIPRIPKIVKFAKKRLGEQKSWKLTKKFKNIKLPGTNTKAYKGMKSWFAKSSDYIKNAKVNLRTVVTTKYAKAIKFATGLKDGFAVLTGFVTAAFNIYTAVRNFGRDDCKELHDKAKEAFQEILEANKTYTSILNNITNAKKEMNKVKDEMIDQVSSEVFLEDLTNMKENMISIQGDGEGMQDMIEATTTYIDQIPSNRDIASVQALMSNLYQAAMGTLPFIYRCLNDRSSLVSTVIRQCKGGFRTLRDQITYSKQLYNYKVEECEQRTGIAYFSDEILQQMVTSLAEKEGFKKECKLNNKDIINSICTSRCTPKRPQKISDLLGVSLKGVENTIKECPLCELNIVHKIIICKKRSDGSSNEDIQKQLYYLTVDQIASVECPPNDQEDEEEDRK